MKKFLKKVNRGIILACAVILCTAVYVAADTVRFKGEKPEVAQAVQQYLKEVRTVNLSAPAERETKTGELLEKYWTDNRQNGYFGYDRENMQAYLEYRKGSAYSEPEITDYTDRIRNLTVSQNGPGGAKVTADYSASLAMSVADTGYAVYGISGEDGSFVSSQPSGDGTGTVQNMECSLEFLLHHEDGQWKIEGLLVQPAEA